MSLTAEPPEPGVNPIRRVTPAKGGFLRTTGRVRDKFLT
jgi:hypothetical protein